jgi:TonB family protein
METAAPDDGYRLGLLPERKIDWRTLATSYGVEILMILALINIGLIWPERLLLRQKYQLTELIPIPVAQPKAVRIKAPKIHARLLPAPLFSAPKLVVPREFHPERVQAEMAPPKVVVNSFAPPVLKQVSAGGARLAQIVHTGEFGSSMAPTLNAPAPKVQTGGFGDPNGISGHGKDGAKLVAANTGSFDMPEGSGYGNGTGGARGLKGTIASAGFGNGIASGGHGDGRSNGTGSVATGTFGAQQVAQATPQHVDAQPTTPLEITYKPNPVYTDEARQMKLEGEVLLDITFAANGQLHVNRVVRGMGHGLDEAAVAAANKMKFKPALRSGTPVDSTAVVRVVFQLAY